ncbi:MAG: GAF domain-containing protein [Tatlockia sp.]|nr:GAF domain-containing protein [Tatlockia sp.]
MQNVSSIRNMKSKRFYQLLSQIYRDTAKTNSIDEILTKLMDVTSFVIGCERGTIFLNDPESGQLYSYVAQGDLQYEIRISNNSGLAGWSFSHNEPLCIDDVKKDKRHNTNIDKINGFNTKNLLCVPLKSMTGELIGVTEMINKNESFFDQSDVRIVEALTEHAAMAIQNKLTIDQIEETHKKDKQFLETISSVSTEITISALLEKIIDTVTMALNAERATLFINDEKTGELYTEAIIGISKKEIRFLNHLGIAGSAFTSGELINISHAYADLRFNPEFDRKTGFFTRSILVVPVRNKNGKIIGVTQALNNRFGEFSAEDEARLFAINAQISIALENSELFEEIQKIKNYNESVLESMTSAVITINENNEIVTCNKAGMKLLNSTSLDEIALKNVSFLFGKDKNKLIEKITLINKGTTQNHDVLMDVELTILNVKITANITIVPLIGSNYERLGVIVIIDDMSTEKRMKSTMSRYMSPNLAEKLLQSNEFSLGGTKTIATVLFSDIRNFTTLSESLGAEETVKLLNSYFSLMVDCIQKEKGILDKFIGDSLMAVFGNPFPHEDDPDRAVRAALEMMKALNQFNQMRNKRGLAPIVHGVGINTDMIVSGNIGSEKRMDFTVIGDGVNLASRIEGLCKHYGASLLISEFTYERLKSTYRTRHLDKVIVKGKVNPVSIYEVIDSHDKRFPNQVDVLNHFNDGIEFYNKADWGKAIACFQIALKLFPEDKPSQVYVDRCRILKAEPPIEEWRGIWKMKNK